MKFTVDYRFFGHVSVEVDISDEDMAEVLEENNIKIIGTEDGIAFIDEDGDEVDIADYIGELQDKILDEAESIDINKDDVFYNAEFSPYSIYYKGKDYYLD